MDGLLIRGGLIVDGSGRPGFAADLLCRGERIEAIGRTEGAAGARVIDATGCVVAPGFIDAHRHCDIAAIDDPDFGRLELAQGITTVVGGNCGLSAVPLAGPHAADILRYLEPITGGYRASSPAMGFEEYFDRLRQAEPPLHVGMLAGSCTIKASLLGFGGIGYAAASLEQARALAARALDAGALGLSMGLMYEPERGSSPDELAQVAGAARERDALLCVHLRSEGDGLLDAIDEAIRIADRAGVRLNISHLKATGAHNWGRLIGEAVGRIERARAAGVEVTADVYPYAAGATTLLSILPPALAALPADRLHEALASRGGVDRLRAAFDSPWPGADNLPLSIGWERIVISSVTREENARFAGQPLSRAADMMGTDPAEALARLILSEKGRCGVIVMSMSPSDVEAVARLPWTAFISDALYGGGERPHPRLHDSFPRFIRKLVLDRRLMTMEEAVRKATSLPAARLGLSAQGLLEPGRLADVVVFRPESMTEGAGFEHPTRAPRGIEWTIVAGRPAFSKGQMLRGGQGAAAAKRDHAREDRPWTSTRG